MAEEAGPRDKVVLDPYDLPVAAGGRKEYTDADGRGMRLSSHHYGRGSEMSG